MSVVLTSAALYTVESVAYPGRVLELKDGSSVANTPIILTEYEGRKSQIWTLRFIREGEDLFTLQAIDPPSYIFSPGVFPGTGIVGNLHGHIELRPYAIGSEKAWQILTKTAVGEEEVAFIAGPNENDQVKFQAPFPADKKQLWRFKPVQ